MTSYYIKQESDNLYIHFDPNTKEYKAMDTLVGSAMFSEIGGKSFIREAGLDDWNMIPINKSTSKTSTSRKNEKKIYNELIK